MAEAGKADTKMAAKPQEKKASKPRIDCIDGCRFALVFPIVIAHFARFGTNNKTMLKLLTQENVLVGGFFVISGYVSAYTSTKLGERKAEDKKLANPELFFWQRVMAYYPLHFVVSAIFAPMFIQVERWYNTPWTMTAFRAFLNFSLLQAWFPAEAEIWNQPTWFLSALTFSNLTMPTFVLPQVAQLSKSGLQKLFAALTGISLLQKVSYSETSRFHSHFEHPVDGKVMYPLIWNLTRFHPFWALIEMTMGVAAVRHVMLDTEEDKKQPTTNPLWLFLLSYASLGLRLTQFDFNDAIIRGVLFVPIFTKFLTQIHRDALSANPAPITRFFGSKPMATLGSIAFPMFILHGPIGQIFYKKVLAKELWGGPMSTRFFPCYLMICLGLSHLTNEYFVKSKKVAAVAGKVASALAEWTEGMLRGCCRGIGVPALSEDFLSWIQLAANFGAEADAKAAAMPPAAKQEVKPVKVSKPRIDCIDGCRFALVFPIVIAHFARFGTSNITALKLLTQENVLVGGFFVISGYVSAYTSTKLGERKAEDKKLANPELFFWQRVMAYYPLHFVMSVIFAPMFIQVERWYNTPWTTTAFRAFLNFSMLQAWFPKEAEIWNQPTWFLSALTFSNLTMPTLVLPQVAQLSKNGLQKLFAALTGISLLQKVSYSETARFHSSKEHPVNGQATHPLIWNLTRFHPFWALIEMTMGIVAARHVMLDTEEDKKKKPTNPLWLFLAAYASLGLRLTRFDFNDAIIRGVLFVPLFTKFLTQMHRDALSADPAPITKFFGSKPMVTLGSIAFPMFILHGPIGQIFYKKVLAKKIWGGPMSTSFFPFYLCICVTLSHLTNEYFVKNKQVGAFAGKVAQVLGRWTEGMLRDRA
ncbi:unnamed protein product [Symbiodinium natans]|uniref:Acyltransferase 3 domain-containing protein n=1 Tax=Symbiodinium natans TaxID=878477 RepID=A0A812I0E0_9DINO|nr:unnamed protein product [Symbiodinium natans]